MHLSQEATAGIASPKQGFQSRERNMESGKQKTSLSIKCEGHSQDRGEG